jgi:DNA-binding transcriptional LysR family regulator
LQIEQQCVGGVDYLKTIESFVAVSTLGSFSAAAEHLGTSRALVTRHVMDLEDRLGSRLLNRSTRRIALTDIGIGYRKFAKKLLDDLQLAEAMARKHQTELEGTLTVIAPKSFGGLHFSTAMARFALDHPKLKVVLMLDDEATHSLQIAQSEFDVAIRLAPLQEKSAAVVRRIGSMEWIVCAAPEYLASKGEPAKPADLADHNCLIHTTLAGDRIWRFGGTKKGVKISGGFLSNSVLALRNAAISGVGIAQLPTYYIAYDLAAGRLVPLLSRFPLPARPVYALLPANRLTPKKTKLFVSFIARWYAGRPWEVSANDANE